jgi:hypothetical protein
MKKPALVVVYAQQNVPRKRIPNEFEQGIGCGPPFIFLFRRLFPTDR